MRTGSVERSSYLDRVRAARFPSSERSSPGYRLRSSSVPRRSRSKPPGGGKNPEINNPRRKRDLQTNQTIQSDRRGQLFLQILSQFLSSFTVVTSAARQPGGPSTPLRGGTAAAQPGEDPSGPGSLTATPRTLPPGGLYRHHPPLMAPLGETVGWRWRW